MSNVKSVFGTLENPKYVEKMVDFVENTWKTEKIIEKFG